MGSGSELRNRHGLNVAVTLGNSAGVYRYVKEACPGVSFLFRNLQRTAVSQPLSVNAPTPALGTPRPQQGVPL